MQDVVLADYQALEESLQRASSVQAQKKHFNAFLVIFELMLAGFRLSSGTCKSGEVVGLDSGDGSDMFGEVMLRICFADEAWTTVNGFTNASHALQWIETTNIIPQNF